MNKFTEEDTTGLQMYIDYCDAKNLLEEINDDFFKYSCVPDLKKISLITEEEIKDLLEPASKKYQMLLGKIEEMNRLFNCFHGIESVKTESFEESPEEEPEEEKEPAIVCILIL